jgi:hypothetical protein
MLIIAITGHWIDQDFRLHEALLSFNELQGTHDDKSIAEAVYMVLNSYNITEKLFCVTTDNASNNDTGVEHLSVLLYKNKGIEWDHEEHHIRCLNHIINIAVQAFLKKCKVIDTEGPEDNLACDDDDLDDEEMRAAEALASDPDFQREIKEVASGFQKTMQKLRDTAKVPHCSAQINPIDN